MKTTSRTNHVSPGTILALGAGVAALATTTYYFFGPKGKTHRDDLKGWMIRMKGEIIDRIEDVKELTEPVYREIIDSVVATYAATTKVSKEELQAFAERLKAQWKDIVLSSEVKAELAGDDAKRTAKRVVRRTTTRAKRSKK
jgi:hypothetical protein